MQHPIPPVFDEKSRVLILGSFPSVASRTAGFFYGHPQNRFWRVLAELFGSPLLQTNEEKRGFLLEKRIALWDAVASCDIQGSSDASIKNVVPNDISVILNAAQIDAIFTNGKKADFLYKKFIFPSTQRKAVCLPSTSPANAAWTFDRLLVAWGKVAAALQRP